MKKFISIFCLIVFFLSFSIGCSNRNKDIGSKDNPIRFYFMPLKSDNVVQENLKIIEDFVEKNSGLNIEPIPAKKFLNIIIAFGKRKADMAFMNTLGYLLANDWAKAEAHLLTLYGDGFKSYRGEILVRSDGNILTPKDLNGKIIAFADPYSASGYLYPLKYLKENNIKPKKTVFADGHINAIEMLYEGKVDAAATYYTKPTEEGTARDARIELVKKYPDIISKVKMLALTDKIPNGPIVLRNDLPVIVKARLIGSLMALARSPEGKKALFDLYNVTGLTLADDQMYNSVRATLKELGKTIQEMVPGGGPYFKTSIIPGLQ